MKYEEIISAFGMSYLKGHVTTTILDDRFCVVDNIEDDNGTDYGYKPVPKSIRFPIKISMSFCLYCKEGNLTVRIQQKDYNLDKGCIIVIFAGQILEDVLIRNDCKIIFIAIESGYLISGMRGPHGRHIRQWALSSNDATLIHVEEEESANFEMLYQTIKRIIMNSSPESMDSILAGFTYIFGGLLLGWSRKTAGKGNAPLSREQKALMQFQEDIHNFSRKEHSITFYAKRQFITSKHFSRLIKKASGKNPMKLIQEYVILDAKSLLLSGKYSVKEVCEKLGFSSQSFFARYFRTVTGKTPTDFIA